MSDNVNKLKAKSNIESQKESSENSDTSVIDQVQGSVEGSETKFEVGAIMSEVPSENRERRGDGDIKTGNSQNDDIKKQEDEIRKMIQKRDPQKIPEKAVRYFVKKAVHQEIRQVQSEIRNLSKDLMGNAYQISEEVKKLRKLKFIMKNMAYWTLDFLRSLLGHVKKDKKIFDAGLPQE
jgi:hypothetical protein